MPNASADAEQTKNRELALQRALLVWIVTGIAFMLLPGTFLGVWNLVSIAGQRGAFQVDPAWIQAHGHAQIFGWIGTFILGIGFYSLSKMARTREFALARVWASWALWSAGAALRWATNLWQWQWRVMLPVSAGLELCGFLLFFAAVSRHRTGETPLRRGTQVWMVAVMAATIGFLATLAANLGVALQSAIQGNSPAIPHGEDQRLLALYSWTFPVAAIWGFSARWLPVFLGLADPGRRMLLAALAVDAAAVVCALAGWWIPATLAFLLAAILAAVTLHVFRPSVKPPKTLGVHATFPLFTRFAYGWLLIAAGVSVAAAFLDRAGGLWGASRHALTVGFISAMVFCIGQRVLPAFCGMRVLFSAKLMFLSLGLLNLGCFLRVTSEIGAYESYVPSLWPLLPVSAVIEMTAVTVFAASLLLTFRQPPAHLAGKV